MASKERNKAEIEVFNQFENKDMPSQSVFVKVFPIEL
ncbi:hypothetical protein HNQ56_002314 [Anaerotaenia torta]